MCYRSSQAPTPNLKVLKPYRSKLRRQQTKAEGRLWHRLRNRRLGGYRFCRQYSVGMYILDFYCHACKLAVEADGGHHANQAQKASDEARTLYLNRAGIRVIRFWNDEILKDMDRVLQEILLALDTYQAEQKPDSNPEPHNSCSETR